MSIKHVYYTERVGLAFSTVESICKERQGKPEILILIKLLGYVT